MLSDDVLRFFEVMGFGFRKMSPDGVRVMLIYAILYYLHDQKPATFPLAVASALHNQSAIALSADVIGITGKMQELKEQDKNPEEIKLLLIEYMNILQKAHKNEIDDKELSLMPEDTLKKKTHAFITTLHDKKLQAYLQNIAWETTTLTDEKLISQLTATVLRYLGGITDLSFLLEFAEAIRQKYGNTTNEKLHQAIEMLHNINEKIADHSLSPTEKDTLHSLIMAVQKVIPSPKANYVDISSFQRENKPCHFA